MKIVITGKNGLLSSEIQKLDDIIIPLDSFNFDITDLSIISKLNYINPDLIIHSAAIKTTKDPCLTINTNIIGTSYLANYCIKNDKRIVYISTDYVYSGDNGNFSEDDCILPHNDYAWTKLGGECSIKLVKNHLIIRTSFGESNFSHEKAWVNQIVSKDYVDIIAPKILKAAKSNLVGTLNIGTNPKTVYDYALSRNKDINPGYLNCEKNFSLNLEKYEKIFGS